jgi:hypothetical protein
MRSADASCSGSTLDDRNSERPTEGSTYGQHIRDIDGKREIARQRLIWLETNMTPFPPTALYRRIQGECSRGFGGRRSALRANGGLINVTVSLGACRRGKS